MSAPVDLLFEGIGRGVSALAAAADPDLPELLREAEGRRLALVVRGTGRSLEIDVQGGALRVLPPRRVSEEGGGGLPAVHEEAGAGPPSGADEPPETAGPGRAGEAGAPGTRPGEGEAEAPETDSGEGGDAGAGGEGAATPEERPGGADLVLAGSVPDFVRFLAALRRAPSPEEPFGRLEVHGSAEARVEFVELLRRVEPDYEALLARAAGGVVAHAVSRTTIGRLFQARRSAARLVDDLAEYLEEEARVVPDPSARSRFAGGVQALIDKVAELEERLDRAR